MVGRCAVLLAAPLFLATLIGCGNGLARVSGQVTLDGQPLRAGSDTRVTVKFQPASGTGPTGVGLVDENGIYSLSTGSQNGLPPGDYLIACSGSQLIKAAGSNAVQGARRITDPKYDNPSTSGLKFTVQSGKNEFNIPLQSAPKTASHAGA
ncbi:MAG TPA: hypothetical protein VHU84_15795 [Lacipirellulaceae bacterium]|nr:hypothetical protein [Lacipirellulaceae bacterium]